MRITDQVLGVVDYGNDDEEVMFCADGPEQARRLLRDYPLECKFTLCRVRIIEVVE